MQKGYNHFFPGFYNDKYDKNENLHYLINTVDALNKITERVPVRRKINSKEVTMPLRNRK
jgi:hypothetical protein